MPDRPPALRRHLGITTEAPPPVPAPAAIVVFLRGGADGLGLVAPVEDPAYRRLRPTLTLRGAGSPGAARMIDGRFALHPGLEPLRAAWEAEELAIVHAVGSDDQTRSHFEAQDRMERGPAREGLQASGWIARLLRQQTGGLGLRAVAMGEQRPESLRGAPDTAVIRTLEQYAIQRERDPGYESALRAMYEEWSGHAVGEAGLRTLDHLEQVGRTANAGALAGRRLGLGYPDHPAAHHLRESIRVLRAGLGVRVATIDFDGWDTHFFQDQNLPRLAGVLGESLAAARRDLGDDLGRVAIVVMTEFGRRAYENGSLGTDHGRGSVMFVLGGAVRGGRVYGPWPGVEADVLVGPGDLPVTTDYRTVLAELCTRHLAARGPVFEHAPAPALGLWTGPPEEAR